MTMRFLQPRYQKILLVASLVSYALVVVLLGVRVHTLDDLTHYSDSIESIFNAGAGGGLTNQLDHKASATVEKEEEEDPILKILRQGGYDVDNKADFTPSVMNSLPNMSEILSLYGPPKILGLETCETFRQKIKDVDRILGVAGTFNTGTNLLHQLLAKNCWNGPRKEKFGSRGVNWQVFWGKHIPGNFRGTHFINSIKTPEERAAYEDVLPVVAVRDPYFWMQSMCRQNYNARFDHDSNHCPNLIPYPEDIKAHPRFAKKQYIPVTVKYDHDLAIKHTSLAHFWNDWYSYYADIHHQNITYPRLMVRMEDLLFHSDVVIPQICDCAGFEHHSKENIRHQAATSNRNHGVELTGFMTGLIRALIKYGNPRNRLNGYAPNQVQAAKTILDPALMQFFGYPVEEPPISPT